MYAEPLGDAGHAREGWVSPPILNAADEVGVSPATSANASRVQPRAMRRRLTSRPKATTCSALATSRFLSRQRMRPAVCPAASLAASDIARNTSAVPIGRAPSPPSARGRPCQRPRRARPQATPCHRSEALRGTDDGRVASVEVMLEASGRALSWRTSARMIARGSPDVEDRSDPWPGLPALQLREPKQRP
jgi:hypothetical protein